MFRGGEHPHVTRLGEGGFATVARNGGDFLGEVSIPAQKIQSRRARQLRQCGFRHPQITFPIMDACFRMDLVFVVLAPPSDHEIQSPIERHHVSGTSLPPPSMSQSQSCARATERVLPTELAMRQTFGKSQCFTCHFRLHCATSFHRLHRSDYIWRG